MSIVFDEEQEALRKSVRAFIEQRSPMTTVRTSMDSETGADSGLWAGFATELGVVGLAVPEAYGGAGYTQVEQAVVFEELGRSLVCSPYFATIGLAANLLLACGDEAACNRYLPKITSGEMTATVATTEDVASWDSESTTLHARADGDHFLLNGHKSFVIDGLTADLILVLARSDAGLGLFAVEPKDGAAVRREPMHTLDLTRKMARLVFTDTPAVLIGAEGSGAEIYESATDFAITALAMEQVGGAQQCLDMTVAYAKVRTQFGRKIGSFQAVKHKCADMLVAVESARSAAYHAVWASVFAADEFPAAAAMAKSVCSDSYTFCATETIQLHGGIGFTWEHDAHLFYRRAHSSALLFGDATHFREVLSQRLGLVQ